MKELFGVHFPDSRITDVSGWVGPDKSGCTQMQNEQRSLEPVQKCNQSLQN
jgi:hypothetical protein